MNKIIRVKKLGPQAKPMIFEMIKTFMKHYDDIMSTIEMDIGESQFFTTSVFTSAQRTGLFYDNNNKLIISSEFPASCIPMHFRKYTKNKDNAYQLKYLKACQYALNQPLKSKALIDFITNTAVASSYRLIERIIQYNRMGMVECENAAPARTTTTTPLGPENHKEYEENNE